MERFCHRLRVPLGSRTIDVRGPNIYWLYYGIQSVLEWSGRGFLNYSPTMELRDRL
jgi:hypothetical protein